MILKKIHGIFEHNHSPYQFSMVAFIEHEIITKVNSGSTLMERNSGTNNPKPWTIQTHLCLAFQCFL